GIQCDILPKFHCELNFIKQCWGYAKQVYCCYPPSSKDADLEANVIKAPNIKIIIYQFATWSCHFMDAYYKGLNGKQVAWAVKKYHGHCPSRLNN
ncbi:hypothetical protein PAXRUDRAFT_157148, partial [Paxillus rubicundulus Ve08.2h10]